MEEASRGLCLAGGLCAGAALPRYRCCVWLWLCNATRVAVRALRDHGTVSAVDEALVSAFSAIHRMRRLWLNLSSTGKMPMTENVISCLWARLALS